MRQRWTSVLLALWAIVMPTVSVLLSADPALAAAPTDCVWADANTIKCDAGTSVYHKQTTPTGVGFYRDTDHEIKVDGSTATGNPGTNNGAGTYTEIASNGAGDISNITIGNVAAAQTASTTPVTPVEVTATDGAGATCDAGNGGLTWIICAAIDHLLAWVDWVRDNVIIPLLKTKPLDQNDPQWTNVYHFWTIMRNIASVCFILLFLVVIFGTAIGYDNYTIKKTLPRLVAAAILMPLSWYVCVLVTDVGVVLGGGLISLGNNLINPPPAIDFNTPFTAAVYGGSGLLLGLTGVVALTQLTSAVLVSVGLFFAGIFFALAWRNVLEIICIVASPLAYLLFVLPATKKYYDLWWKTLWTVSLLYAEYVAGVEGARMAAATLSGFGGFTPLIQLALLGVVPFLVMIWAVRGGNNKLMAAGTNAWKRGIGDQVDKRFGKDSARGKAQAESRKNNNLLRQATIQDWTNSKKTKVGRGLAKTVGFLGVQAYGMRAGTQSGLGYGVGRASQSKANKIKDVKSARGVENTIDTDKVERQTYRETSQEKRAQDLNTSVASLAASKGTARALSETVNNVDGANRKKQLSTFAARSAAGVEAQQRLTLGAQFGERSSDAGHGVVNGRFNPTLNRAPTMGQIDYAAGRDKFYDTQAKYGGIARAGEHYATIESAINKQFGGGPMTPARIAQIRNTMANNALAAGHGAAEAARFTTQATGMAKLRSGSPDGTSKFNAKYIEASDETYRNDGKVDATNQALDEEIDKVIDAEKAASGTTLSRNEARTRVFNNSRAASRIATKAGLRETRGKEAGVIEGLDKAADDLIKAENILPGATLEDQRQEATRRLYNAVSSTATVQGAASTAKQFGDAAGKLVGFQEASIETAIDDKIASDAALGKKTSRMDAEKAVRKEAQYATGTDVKQGVLASAGANSEIQKVAQEARQSARTDTLKQFEGTRAAANGEDRAIGVATDQAVADLTERIYKTSQKSKDPAKRLDRAAARKMATTAIMDERVQRDIRNQMTSNLAAQAREAGTNKVLDQFNSAEAAALGIERGEAKAAQELMKQRSDELMAEGLSRPRADAETRRLVNGPQGQQYVQGQIARKRNEAAVFAGAQATAASIITPFSVVKANQATIDRVATEQNIQAETERIAASMAKSGAPVDMARARELAEQSVARGARLSATGAAISGRRNQNAAAVTSRSIGQEEARDLAIAGKINQRQIIEDERFLNAQKDEVARSSINEVVVDRKTGKRTVVQGTINTINLNKDNIAGLRQAAEKAYENGDLATFLAIGESLARNGGGRDEITKLQVDLFGRTNSQLISESAMQKAKERFGENFDLANFNNLFVAKVNRSARPDAYLPPDIAFDEMSPAAARQLDKRGWGHFLRWIGDRERRSRLPASDAAHVSKEDYNRNLNEAVAAINETLVSTRAREDLESNQFDRMREFAFDWNRATKRYTAFDGTEITNRADLEAAIARAKAAGKKHPVRVRTDLVTGREVPIRDSAYDFLLETLRNEMS